VLVIFPFEAILFILTFSSAPALYVLEIWQTTTMSSYFKKLRLPSRVSREGSGTYSLDDNTNKKEATGVTTAYDGKTILASGDEPEADKLVAPGELSFEEDTSGGLGRHLGLFSTTLLM
jgi:hypothetical protein